MVSWERWITNMGYFKDKGLLVESMIKNKSVVAKNLSVPKQDIPVDNTYDDERTSVVRKMGLSGVPSTESFALAMKSVNTVYSKEFKAYSDCMIAIQQRCKR